MIRNVNINVNDYDVERIRNDLIESFTAQIVMISPIALTEIVKFEIATDVDLIRYAMENRLDLNKYLKKDNTYRKRYGD